MIDLFNQPENLPSEPATIADHYTPATVELLTAYRAHCAAILEANPEADIPTLSQFKELKP